MSRSSLRCKGYVIVLAVCLIYWILVSLWGYFSFDLNLKSMILIVELFVKRRIAEEEKRRADERLSQASKLESLGRLAGGVAHDLNGLISHFRGLLEKTLREDMRLTLKLWDGTLPVRCDKGQIEQILMNLIINGQDTMSGGGEIDVVSQLGEGSTFRIFLPLAGRASRGNAV